jgi:hypothetical protein
VQAPRKRPLVFDMEVIARLQNSGLCASITCMIRHYVARRAKVIFDHPPNAEERMLLASLTPRVQMPDFVRQT